MKRMYQKPEVVSQSIQASALAVECCCVCCCDPNLEIAGFLGNWTAERYRLSG
jgi:hypothetical protein